VYWDVFHHEAPQYRTTSLQIRCYSGAKGKRLTAYDKIKIFKLDVTDIHQVQVATEQAISAFGKIDGVVLGGQAETPLILSSRFSGLAL